MSGLAQQVKRPVDVSSEERAEPQQSGSTKLMKRPVDVSNEQRAEPRADRCFVDCVADQPGGERPPGPPMPLGAVCPQRAFAPPESIFETRKTWEARA